MVSYGLWIRLLVEVILKKMKKNIRCKKNAGAKKKSQYTGVPFFMGWNWCFALFYQHPPPQFIDIKFICISYFDSVQNWGFKDYIWNQFKYWEFSIFVFIIIIFSNRWRVQCHCIKSSRIHKSLIIIYFYRS